MPTLAEVIPLHAHRPGSADRSRFSVDDEAMTSRLTCMLADELATWGDDSSASARVSFCIGFHRSLLHRWIRLLAAQEADHSRQVAHELSEALQRVDANTELKIDMPDPNSYRRELNQIV